MSFRIDVNKAARFADKPDAHKPVRYRPDVDGLRAIAITSVVAYHAGLQGVKGGFVGVDVFFVISGYLIGSLVYKEIRSNTFSIAHFYERRAKRILPTLFGILSATYIIAVVLLARPEIRQLSKFAIGTLTCTANILFWRNSGYFAPSAELNPLLMTWSLSVEEQFYLLFPVLMLLLRGAGRRLQLLVLGGVAALSLLASVLGASQSSTAAFYLLPARAWELAAGVLLAVFEASRDHERSHLPGSVAQGLSILGAALIGLSIIAFDSNTPFPGYAALMPVAGAVCIIAARKGLVNRVLSVPALVFVGRISYSWYLWHWPLLSFARMTSETGRISKTIGLIIALISFGCAVLSYRFVESPFRRSTTPATPLLARYGAAVAAMLLLAVGIHSLPDLHPAVQKVEETNKWITDACLTTDGAVHPRLTPPCVPAGNGRAVALIGDSHAAALSDGLRPLAVRSGYRLIELDKTFCPALDGVTNFSSDSPLHERECAEYNRERLRFLLSDASIQAVVVVGYWSEPFESSQHEGYVADSQNSESISTEQSWDNLQRGIDGLVVRLTRAGKVVYLCQDNPHFAPLDPLKSVLNRLIIPRGQLASLLGTNSRRYSIGLAQDLLSANDRRIRVLISKISAAHPAVRLVDLRSAFCEDAHCRFAEGEQTYFIDSQHLSSVGARRAVATLQLGL